MGLVEQRETAYKAYAEGFGTLYATTGENEFFGQCGTHDSRQSLCPTCETEQRLKGEYSTRGINKNKFS